MAQGKNIPAVTSFTHSGVFFPCAALCGFFSVISTGGDSVQGLAVSLFRYGAFAFYLGHEVCAYLVVGTLKKQLM